MKIHRGHTCCVIAILLDMNRITCAPLALMVFAAVPLNAQQTGPGQQNAGQQSCPDTMETVGRYVNTSYGFSIDIPKDLKAVWNSARCANDNDGCVCMSDHGRIIPLHTENNVTDHWIEAYAGFAAALDEPTLNNAVDARLDSIRRRSRDGSISILRRLDVSLGGLKAKRLLVRYYDKTSNRLMMEDFVQALRERPEVPVEYDVYLRTSFEAYEQQKAILDSVLRTFVLTECDNC